MNQTDLAYDKQLILPFVFTLVRELSNQLEALSVSLF